MPDRENDPEWMLYFAYFGPCELMRYNSDQMRAQMGHPRFEEASHVFIAWTLYWFASLFVVAEGWKDLKLSDPHVNGLINAHYDSLRLLRNAVFHYQEKDHKHRQWFDLDKFNWAVALHNAFRQYFTAKGFM